MATILQEIKYEGGVKTKVICTTEPVVIMGWAEFAELLKELPANRVRHYIRAAGIPEKDEVSALMSGQWDRLERKLICEMGEQL